MRDAHALIVCLYTAWPLAHAKGVVASDYRLCTVVGYRERVAASPKSLICSVTGLSRVAFADRRVQV